MGGDGGTISSNRTYLRGAGKACHTADHKSNALKRSKLEDAENSKLILSTCAITGALLDLSPTKTASSSSNGGRREVSTVSGMDIVACPYGKLYKREKVLEALLYRSQTGGGGGGDSNNNTLGTHIRGMKDLHPVRFHVTTSTSFSANGVANGGSAKQTYTPTCPITGSEIGSGNIPCYLIVRTKKSKDKTKDNDEVELNPNVLSESAIKEMGIAGLQTEYGPFEEEDLIRLAPPTTGGVFEEIRRKWESRMEEERIAKVSVRFSMRDSQSNQIHLLTSNFHTFIAYYQLKKKKDKKRKKPHTSPTTTAAAATQSESKSIKRNTNGGGKKPASEIATQRPANKKSAVDEARSTVQSSIAQNAVLSNLFGTDKAKSNKTEDEKRRELFTRNC